MMRSIFVDEAGRIQAVIVTESDALNDMRDQARRRSRPSRRSLRMCPSCRLDLAAAHCVRARVSGVGRVGRRGAAGLI